MKKTTRRIPMLKLWKATRNRIETMQFRLRHLNARVGASTCCQLYLHIRICASDCMPLYSYFSFIYKTNLIRFAGEKYNKWYCALIPDSIVRYFPSFNVPLFLSFSLTLSIYSSVFCCWTVVAMTAATTTAFPLFYNEYVLNYKV